MLFVRGKIVEELGTCSASKISNAVLKKMGCELEEKRAMPKSLSALKPVCIVAVDYLSSLIGFYGAAEFDCDPEILKDKVIGAQLCENLN